MDAQRILTTLAALIVLAGIAIGSGGDAPPKQYPLDTPEKTTQNVYGGN